MNCIHCNIFDNFNTLSSGVCSNCVNILVVLLIYLILASNKASCKPLLHFLGIISSSHILTKLNKIHCFPLKLWLILSL